MTSGMTKIHGLFIDGSFIETSDRHPIVAPHGGEVVAERCEADLGLMRRALEAAHNAFPRLKGTSRWLRSRLLAAMADGIAQRKGEFIDAIVEEAGKPVGLAEAEVSRALVTFGIGTEEAKRYGGEVFPLDIEPNARAYGMGVSILRPKGPVFAITPFNFPLNLVAHKVVPALAVGAPVIVKPAPQTPGAARLLAEVFQEAAKQVGDSMESIPAAALQVVSAPNAIVALATSDPRIAVLSFTGSAAVGWTLQSMARGKKVALELGGNAFVLVHGDAELERAAARSVFGAFAYSGQVCISVQNVLVDRRVYPRFRELFLAEVAKVKCGDPRERGVLVGPVVNGATADRIMDWIGEARSMGAAVLAGGNREGNLISPTVLEGVPKGCRLDCEEAFGPVVSIGAYDDLDVAIAAVNGSRYGLQAGLFTDSQRVVRRVVEELEVGAVLVNEVPTYRADHMPYGGVKESGLGREGVRYAMEEYSERKTVVTYEG